MAEKQFQVSVRAQASKFLDHLAKGHFRSAETKMTSMTYFWHGATFGAKALGQNLPAKFPELWTAWDQLHTAWCALPRLGDESGSLKTPTESELAALKHLATALHDRAMEAGGAGDIH